MTGGTRDWAEALVPPMEANAVHPTDEDESGFLARRAAEERQKAAESSCMVRTAHEDLSESYEERLAAAQAETAALERLAAEIGGEVEDKKRGDGF